MTISKQDEEENKHTWTVGDLVIWIVIILVIWGAWSLISSVYTNLTAKWTIVTYSELVPYKESELGSLDNLESKAECIKTGKSALINNKDVKTWRCFKLPADKFNLDKDTLKYCYPEGCVNSK
jgi:hypothetical protein